MEEPVLSTRGRRWMALLGIALAIAAWGLARGAELPPAACHLAATTVLMAVYWATQPIPIAVTSLIPIALYPLLGIAGARQVCAAYGESNVFLYLGGFVIALGLERWDLHRRIALNIVSAIGTSTKRLVYGFAFATAALSMWISNTATTLLMLPIALSLVQMLEEELPGLAGSARGEALSGSLSRFTVALLLAVAFGATCGGLATFVGTPTNTSFRGFWERMVEAGAEPISAGEWMLAFIPLSAAMLTGVCVMTTWRLRPLPGLDRLGREFCRSRLAELGPMSSGARWMLAVFLAAATLWMTREPIALSRGWEIPGWRAPLTEFIARRTSIPPASFPAVDDSTVAILLVLAMFVLQGRRPGDAEPRPLMDWATVQERLPWGVLLLFGGGFAMADAFRTTGLADWLGGRMSSLSEGTPLWAMTAAVCSLVTLLSEFTSNVATVNTALPMLAPLADGADVDPRLLLIPAAISASFGFMLPVATPPNAIVYGTGRVPVRQMMLYGFALDVLGVVLIVLFSMTILPAVFVGG
ncbi:MAG: anion permease [Planctomyces sp.]|nr:anion permease [Planctomyces sp.]